MTPENFVYWLQGFFELKEYDGGDLTPTQVDIIKDHIKLVLCKQTPTYNFGASPSQQALDLSHTTNWPSC